MNNKLSVAVSERKDFDHLEAVIKDGLKTFWEVGHALAEIRDKRLYREEYDTFREYCDKKWGFSDRRARQLISSAEVVDDVKQAIKNGGGKSGTVVPLLDERKTRELVSTPPARRATVLTAAAKTAPNGTLTASHIKHVAQTAREYPKAKSIGALVHAHLEQNETSRPTHDALMRQEQRILEALQAIQAQKLWRATSNSFDEYIDGLVERIQSDLQS
jgi:hypothetical protein